jgi:bifunctional enzyme CysN/CysC/sulfate adenylyltransferase subunit 1
MDAPLRFPIQLVLRPDAGFRGYAGQVASGVMHPGDRVIALPSRRETSIRSIVTYDGNLDAARHGMSVAVELEDAIDLSRGEMLVSPGRLPHIARSFSARVVWMHEDPLRVGAAYLAKHSTRTVRVTVTAIRHRVDIATMLHVDADLIAMNDIAEVEFEAGKPLFFDSYLDNRDTGNLILIDPLTNATVGAAMISNALGTDDLNRETALPVVLHWPGRRQDTLKLIDALRGRGNAVVDLDDEHIPEAAIAAAVRAAQMANAIAISSRASLPLAELNRFLDAGQLLTRGENQDEAAAYLRLGLTAQ